MMTWKADPVEHILNVFQWKMNSNALERLNYFLRIKACPLDVITVTAINRHIVHSSSSTVTQQLPSQLPS